MKWQVIDDNIPTRDAAEAIIRMRYEGNRVVRPLGIWNGYEMRVRRSVWHRNGSFQIEARKITPRPAASD